MASDMHDTQRELEYRGDVDYPELMAEAELIAQGPTEELLVSFASGNHGREEREKLCGRLDDDAKFRVLDIRYRVNAARYGNQPASIIIRRRKHDKLAS